MHGGVRLLDDYRLGAERHSKTRGRDHAQVVGAIAHCDCAPHINIVFSRPLAQALLLDVAIDDAALHPAGEDPPPEVSRRLAAI